MKAAMHLVPTSGKAVAQNRKHDCVCSIPCGGRSVPIATLTLSRQALSFMVADAIRLFVNSSSKNSPYHLPSRPKLSY